MLVTKQCAYPRRCYATFVAESADIALIRLSIVFSIERRSHSISL
jgi:hypothetical protein